MLLFVHCLYRVYSIVHNNKAEYTPPEACITARPNRKLPQPILNEHSATKVLLDEFQPLGA